MCVFLLCVCVCVCMQQTWLICVSEIDFIMHARVYVRCVVCVALLMWAFFCLVWTCVLFVFVCLFVVVVACCVFFLLCTYVLMHDVIFMNVYICIYPSLFCCCVCCVCVYYFSFVIHQRVFIYLLFMC